MSVTQTAVDTLGQHAQCQCSTVSVRVTGRPLLRGYCHCTTCQKYTGQDYSDVSVFRASDVTLNDESSIDFKVYQKPKLVQRGRCNSCQRATVEKISVPLLPDLIILATDMLPAELTLEPSMHIFYHRRVREVTDNVPRYEGFAKSQWVFMSALIKSLVRTRKSSTAV